MENKKATQLLHWPHLIVSEPYYLFHFLAFLSYFLVRTSASSVLSPEVTGRLLCREIQAILAFSILIAIKMVKEESWEAFIADAMFYAKVLVIALALTIDYHLALWYTMIFSVIFILTHQPPFDELGMCNKLTPLQLEAILTEGNTPKSWLVEFRSSCSSTCVRTSCYFPQLSITYSNKNFSFGIIDLGLFPNAAEKFGISLSGSMAELPTYILFENATEVSRLPQMYSEVKASQPSITKKLLCQHFELDRRLLEYVKSK